MSKQLLDRVQVRLGGGQMQGSGAAVGLHCRIGVFGEQKIYQGIAISYG